MNRRLRWVAPTDDGRILVDLPGPSLEAVVERNRQKLRRTALFRIPIDEWQSTWRDTDLHTPTIVTGHQPEWVHPGVWLKHFVAYRWARQMSGRSIHVSIDTDVSKGASLALPRFSSDPSQVSMQIVPYDRWEGETLWADLTIREPARFLSFPQECHGITGAWPFEPVLFDYWKRLTSAIADPESIRWCDVIDAARRSYESEWGTENEERSARHLWEHHADRFLAELLRDLARFRDVYNEAVRAYRRRHRLRSRQHPVPELGEIDGFLEAPCWFVRHGRRYRVFLKRSEGAWEGRIGAQTLPRLEDQPQLIHSIATVWGYQVYPRALLTTMMLRLFLADVFIHGIGGAKYDEVTDDILRGYFGIDPPEYAVVSGTLRLPFPLFPATDENLRQVRAYLRRLRWHPEQFVDHRTEWVEQKERWLVQQPQTRAERRARYRELLALTEALRPMVEPLRAAAQSRLDRIELELAANEVLRRRDYAWILHPAARLRDFLTETGSP